jgi:glycosyltransferase 2 family protein
VSPWAKRIVAAARRPVVSRIFKLAVVALVVYIVGNALKGYRTSLAGRVDHLQLGWIGVAVGLSILYRIFNAYAWILVLRSLGQRMPVVTGVRMWLVTETFRWLPGSLWGLFSRAGQAKATGIPAVTASISIPLELLLSIAAWGLTAVAALSLSGTAGTLLSRLPTFWLVASAAALVVTVGSAFALARWGPSTAISRKIHGLQESLRQLTDSRPRLPWLATTLAFVTALSFLQGAAFLAVLRAASDSIPTFLAAAGINAAGWLVGFFAFFAPTGIGVREGGMAAMLAPLMPVDAAVVGVLLWRLIQIVVELLCLGACFVPRAASALRRLAARTFAET